jgi:hypothetical protein
MTGLARPPDQWEPDATKPGVGSTGLAAIPGGVVVTADVGRHEIRERTQGWLLRPDLQESPRPLRTIDIGSLKHRHALDASRQIGRRPGALEPSRQVDQPAGSTDDALQPVHLLDCRRWERDHAARRRSSGVYLGNEGIFRLSLGRLGRLLHLEHFNRTNHGLERCAGIGRVCSDHGRSCTSTLSNQAVVGPN